MLPAWIILIFLGIGFIALLIFLFRRNQKDRRAFEQQLNQDYKKPGRHKDEETDAPSI